MDDSRKLKLILKAVVNLNEKLHGKLNHVIDEIHLALDEMRDDPTIQDQVPPL